MLDEFDAGERKDLIPIYLRVGKLHTWTVTESVRRVLDVLDDVPDALPDEVRTRRDLVGAPRPCAASTPRTPSTRSRRPGAGCATKRPSSSRRPSPSGGVRPRRSATRPAPARPGGLLDAFDARLPFALTDGQREVGGTVGRRARPGRRRCTACCRARSAPARRSWRCARCSPAVDAGGQAALLAPTEVLAAQHHRTITAMLGDLATGGMLGGAEHGTRVALLTGSRSTAARRKALARRR